MRVLGTLQSWAYGPGVSPSNPPMLSVDMLAKRDFRGRVCC